MCTIEPNTKVKTIKVNRIVFLAFILLFIATLLLPVYGAGIEGASQVCAGQTVRYYASAPPSQNGDYTDYYHEYLWSVNGTPFEVSQTYYKDVTWGSALGTVSVRIQQRSNINPPNMTPKYLVTDTWDYSLTVSSSPTPGSVNGLDGSGSTCQNSEITYTVENTTLSSGASYFWSIPNGVEKIAQTPGSVTVRFNTIGAFNIGVRQQNGCNQGGAWFYKAVTVSEAGLPQTPYSITGDQAICQGFTFAYTTPDLGAGITYEWSVPTGASIIAGQGSREVSVQFSNNATGNITVRSKNSCGSYSAALASLPLTQSDVSNPLSFTLPAYACPGMTVKPTFIGLSPEHQVSGLEFVWSITGAATFDGVSMKTYTMQLPYSEDNVPVIYIDANATGNIKIELKVQDKCGNSSPVASQEMVISSIPPANITSISGQLFVCTGTIEEYSVPDQGLGILYEWTLPIGTRFDYGSNELGNTIRVFFSDGGPPGRLGSDNTPFNGGNINVKAYNACGDISAVTTLYIQKRKDNISNLAFTGSTISGVKNLYLNSCTDLVTCSPKFIKKAVLKAKLDFGETFNDKGLASSLKLIVRSKNHDGTFTAAINKTVTLSVDSNNPEQLFVHDFTEHHAGLDNIEVTVTDFTLSPATTNPDAVRLLLYYEEDAAYAVSNGNNGIMARAVRVNSPVMLAGPDKNLLQRNNAVKTFEQSFYWQTNCTDLKHFELQIAPDRGGSISSFEHEEEKLAIILDVENAVLEGGYFKHTFVFAEGSGRYKWRVRHIGSLENGIANPANWGSWSQSQTFEYTQPDEDKNWIYSRTFTEGSRVAEKLVYANGLQQLQQTQTRLSSGGHVVAMQTIQDLAGRDAVQSLPIPILGENKLGYKANLIKNVGGGSYNALNFDQNINYRAPEKATEVGYYSGILQGNSTIGTNEGVANAEGYAFSRTLFANDGTNRVVEQSGVGAYHKIGSGHTVRTFYSGVSEAEMVRVFGKEAPKASKVQKILTQDPNGTTSVSYQTEDGKVVATALSIGGGATALVPLTSKADGGTVIYEKIEEKSSFNGVGSTTKKALLVPTATTLTVNYSITPKSLAAICASVCKTCDYKVEILLHNQDEPGEIKTVLSHIISPGDCGTITPVNLPRSIALEANVPYMLEKRVTAYVDAGLGDGRTNLDVQLSNLRQTYEQQLEQGIWLEINNFINNNNVEGLYSYLNTRPEVSLTGETGTQHYEVPLFCEDGTVIIRIPFILNDCKDENSECPPNFADYFEEVWGDNGSNPDGIRYTWNQAFPTMTKQEFNGIISFMLSETARTKTAGDSYYWPLDATGTAVQKFNCGDLWDCWRGQVQSFDVMTKNMGGLLLDQTGKQFPYSLLESFMQCTGAGVDKVYATGAGPTTPDKHYRYLEFNNTDTEHDVKCVQAFAPAGTALTATAINALAPDVRMNIIGCLQNGQKESKTAQELVNEYKPKADNACKDVCEGMRGAFEQAVIRSLHEQGRQIEGDLFALIPDAARPGKFILSNDSIASSTFVSQCEIDKTVDELVANCKGDCNLTVNIVDEGTPTARYKLGTDEELESLKKIVNGKFTLNVLPAGSTGCTEEGYGFLNGLSTPTSPWKIISPLFSINATYDNYVISTKTDIEGNVYSLLPLQGLSITLKNGSQIPSDANSSVLIKYSKTGEIVWRRMITIRAIESASNFRTAQSTEALSSPTAEDAAHSISLDMINGNIAVKVMRPNSYYFKNTIVSIDGVDRIQLNSDHYATVAYFEPVSGGFVNSVNIDSPGTDFSKILLVDELQNSYDAVFNAQQIKMYKRDQAGNVVWVSELNIIGNPGYGSPATLVNDKEGNVYMHWRLAGAGNVDFVLPNGTALFSGLIESDVLLKCKRDGGFEWVKMAPGVRIIPGDSSVYLLGRIGKYNGQSYTYNDNETPLFELDSNGNVVSLVRLASSTLCNCNGTFSTTHDKIYGLGASGYNTSFFEFNKISKAWEIKDLSPSSEFHYSYLNSYITNNNKLRAIVKIKNHSSNTIRWGNEEINNFSTHPDREPHLLVEYDFAYNPSSCSSLPVCLRWEDASPAVEVPPFMEKYVYDDTAKPCGEVQIEQIKGSISAQISNELDKKLALYKAQYAQTCATPENLDDNFSISYSTGMHHYTLYYYDRAGRLQRTVPPGGVELLPVTNATEVAAAKLKVPAHVLVTSYKYNSLGQLVEQQTPDAGITKFYYDSKGQLRFSQNAAQVILGAYSYTKYDALGRVVEVGESTLAGFANRTNDQAFPGSLNRHITRTEYSKSKDGLTYLDGNAQKHLLNRVSYTYTDEDGSEATLGDRNLTYYSYDAHGNVAWLAQEVAGLGRKYIGYEYDLISGKVLRVNYQQGQADQFFHKYEYDADNRITAVHTSTDGQLWDKDAAYAYYAHGPLRRTTLGEDKVQGLDYTYTIQGWLKGMNDGSLQPAVDPGQDGVLSNADRKDVARDAFGMMLGYYNKDFLFSYPTKKHALDDATISAVRKPLAGRDLYNGNIAAWSMSQLYKDEVGETKFYKGAEQFQYDELNRLKSGTYREVVNALSSTSAFATNYDYDANGNLTWLERKNRNGFNMDRLTYYYAKDSQGRLRHNKLVRVGDPVSADFTTTDIDNQPANNYGYDAVGNLVKDVQSGITKISWSPYGKALEITKGTGQSIRFGYDASGNRVSKRLNGSTTYYVRDASGNTMGVYEHSGTELKLTEQPIYGSARVGQRQLDLTLGAAPATGEVFTRTLGMKMYELSDHLGNVRTVLSDRKKLTTDGSYEPDVHSYAGYYAFGMQMQDRTGGQPDAYRYGYNGKEKDSKGEWGLTNLDFGARMYNPAIGRWLSVDPQFKNYSAQSPYAGFNNSPILFNDPTGESGEVSINKNTKTITVRSTMIFYGDEASPQMAKETAKSIQNKWNVASGKVNINGTVYDVKFEIQGKYRSDIVLPGLGSLLEGEINRNKDIKNNYIRIENQTDSYWDGDVSYNDDNGNTGYWSTVQLLGSKGTTASHEYGHGLGLHHPDDSGDAQRQNPHIMMIEGDKNLVKPQYLNSSGLLDTSKRKVTQQNIDELGLDKLKYDNNGKASIGNMSNEYHHKKKDD